MQSVVPSVPLLGSKKLFETLFREVLGTSAKLSLTDIRAYCLSRVYRVGPHVGGAIKLLVNIEVLTCDGDSIGPGKHFSEIVKSSDLGLSISQILINALQSTGEINDIFRCGSLSRGDENQLYVHRSQIGFRHLPIIRLLRDLGALHESHESSALLVAIPAIAKLLFALSFDVSVGSGRMTPDDFRALQKANAAQAEAAEEFVLAYECLRLNGHPRLELIRRISLENIAAGYDIISFESLTSVVPDRFIEVKSFRGAEQFFFSAAESAAAKELTDRYFIYIVNATAMADRGYEPQIVQNPAKFIFQSSTDWSVDTAVWQISRRR